MKLYSISETAEKLKLNKKYVFHLIKKQNIPCVKQGRSKFIKECDLSLFKLNYYKVSIFDANIYRYVVKRCCLKKAEADELVKEYSILGIASRVSRH